MGVITTPCLSELTDCTAEEEEGEEEEEEEEGETGSLPAAAVGGNLDDGCPLLRTSEVLLVFFSVLRLAGEPRAGEG